MGQEVYRIRGDWAPLDAYLRRTGARTVLLVHGGSLRRLPAGAWLDGLEERTGIRTVPFTAFRPDPDHRSVTAGVELFRREGCGAVLAVGGGSAIDVAKCVWLYGGAGPDPAWLDRPPSPCGVPLIAVPTTAGTGSEATHFAVVYRDGRKYSVAHPGAVPCAAFLDPRSLRSLPPYQKKSTLLDALCHGVESFWSVNSTEESVGYAREAVGRILRSVDGYLSGGEAEAAEMMEAAHLAGRAIDIGQTTAGHALCYKIGGLYGVSHGHAAALADRVLWPWMLSHTDRCVDPRGEGHLRAAFDALGEAMGERDAAAGAAAFGRLFDRLGMEVPRAREEDHAVLTASVDPVRLKNNPVALDAAAIEELYRQILRGP